ncbi:MAG: MarR family transcriptional regulator [Micrococcales bacterium]|nr:MarR family transcriptional regulator [Micrococcales bacterium]
MSRGPLRDVLDSVDRGALTVAEIVDRTALPRETVQAALEQLQRLGHLAAEAMPAGCPPTGCGSCAVTCGERSGPVLIGLSRRR